MEENNFVNQIKAYHEDLEITIDEEQPEFDERFLYFPFSEDEYGDGGTTSTPSSRYEQILEHYKDKEWYVLVWRGSSSRTSTYGPFDFNDAYDKFIKIIDNESDGDDFLIVEVRFGGVGGTGTLVYEGDYKDFYHLNEDLDFDEIPSVNLKSSKVYSSQMLRNGNLYDTRRVETYIISDVDAALDLVERCWDTTLDGAERKEKTEKNDYASLEVEIYEDDYSSKAFINYHIFFEYGYGYLLCGVTLPLDKIYYDYEMEYKRGKIVDEFLGKNYIEEEEEKLKNKTEIDEDLDFEEVPGVEYNHEYIKRSWWGPMDVSKCEEFIEEHQYDDNWETVLWRAGALHKYVDEESIHNVDFETAYKHFLKAVEKAEAEEKEGSYITNIELRYKEDWDIYTALSWVEHSTFYEDLKIDDVSDDDYMIFVDFGEGAIDINSTKEKRLKVIEDNWNAQRWTADYWTESPTGTYNGRPSQYHQDDEYKTFDEAFKAFKKLIAEANTLGIRTVELRFSTLYSGGNENRSAILVWKNY